MKSKLGGHYDLSSEMLFVVDQSLRFTSVNNSFEQKMGWKFSELSQKKITDFLLTEEIEKLILAVNNKSNEIVLNLHFRKVDGPYQTLLFRFVWDPANCNYLGFIKDQATEAHFDIIFRSMSEGVVVQDNSNRVIHFNQAALDILGLTADQLIGKTSHDPQWKVFDEKYEAIQSKYHPAVLALQTGKTQKNSIMGVQNKMGDNRWLSVTAVPLFLPNEPKPYQVIVTFNDLTAEVEAKKNIEKKENEISILLNAIPSMIGRWDANLINTHANAAYSNYFNKHPHEIKGRHISELIGGKLYEQNKPFLEKCLKGESQTFERDIPLPDGKNSRSTIACYVPDFFDGKVIGIFVVVTDVTELKRLEKTQRELELKLISGSRLAALGEMAAGIAHEINNPLAIIRSKSEYIEGKLKKGEMEPEVLAKGFVTIRTTIDRIASIISGLRSFSRDADKDPFVKSRASSLIKETLEFCQERFEKKGVELKLNIEKELDINCRPVQISQVLMNLLLNSFDAILDQKNKWIRVDLKSVNDMAVIEVTDSGLGIPEKIVDKIMQPFFTTKGVGKGTGLGLSISSGIIANHFGSLEYVPDSPNTCFRISLPIYKMMKSEINLEML